jgi:fructan beta-fructosidase
MHRIKYGLILMACKILMLQQAAAQPVYQEQYRPKIHFSPMEKWVNDPNGMVYANGVYHLFFQYYPDSTVWGPMHWGHATSADLVHWKEQPVALYPDSLGYIFSGSAVVDKNNSSGFGKNGQPPLVAIFTHHDPVGAKQKTNNYQTQSLAYSNDDGKTWVKYTGNPVLANPGIEDFRDPKVMWLEAQKKWLMTLAVKDRISFYSSPDLKKWTKESDFGQDIGAHGGVWECPDLFTLNENGKPVWVLIVNINPGGPNKGSATQYFLGDFDGNKFTPNDTTTRWLDYGPDEYAGITWSNTGNRKIFLGWMSNWLYANLVPTVKWRNAMTIPRELSLKRAGKELLVASVPVSELNKINSRVHTFNNVPVSGTLDLSTKVTSVSLPCRLSLAFDQARDFSVVLTNKLKEEVVIGFDHTQKQYYIDRTNSGVTNFQKDFAAKHVAPRFVSSDKMNLSLIIDETSVELFADDGLTVMTEIFFPGSPFNQVLLKSPEKLMIKKLEYTSLKSIWK